MARAARGSSGQVTMGTHGGEQSLGKEAAMWTRVGVIMVTLAVATITLGCSQQSARTASTTEEKTYTVTPGSVAVKAGILTGEVTEMKITERIEKSADHVVSAAKLTG